MILHDPFKISARLAPAVQVDGAWISIEATGQRGEYGKRVWRWAVDLPSGESFEGEDLQGHGGYQSIMADLIGFLGACGSSVNYERDNPDDVSEGDNTDLFPRKVAEWAADHEDDLAILECVLEENDNLIEEGKD